VLPEPSADVAPTVAMRAARYRLAPPGTPEDWEHYHRIRRTVLWERRGLLGTYDERHPDEHRPGHHPLLLTFDGAPVGVVRVDVDGDVAFFRRVAVSEDVQRQGHGRALLGLAEAFARGQGCGRLQSSVASDAAGFYAKCGFRRDAESSSDPHHVPMHKTLRAGDIDTLFSLIDYEVWCNERMLDCLDGLSEAECKRDFGFGHGTPHRTMFHIADVMRGWSRAVGPVIETPTWLTYQESVTLSEIRTLLTDAAGVLRTAARASHAGGVLGAERRLHQVFHLVTHGTHHRGQLLSMLTLMGRAQPFEGGDFGGWSNGLGSRGFLPTASPLRPV